MEQFNKVASLYAKVRPTYPKAVYEKILGRNNGKKYNRAADIGCGAGHSIEGLKSICRDIVGVEPGNKLRLEAMRKYPEFEFVKGSGENTNIAPGSVDLVTVATAFYWMDRGKAIKEIGRILTPKGKLALYRYRFPKVESEANQVIESHCKQFWDQYREERLVREDDSDVLLSKSPLFTDVCRSKVDNIWRLSIADFVRFLTSTSYLSRYLESLGNESEVYIENFTKELHKTNKSEVIDVNFDIHMIFANKI